MKKPAIAALTLLVVGCATTYHLPEEERSRAYQAGAEEVWDAAVAGMSVKFFLKVVSPISPKRLCSTRLIMIQTIGKYLLLL